jgi:protein-tyrosine phosphatase
MAEAMLRHRLDRLGVDAVVHSAGVSIEGRPASPPGVQVLGRRGLDITAHRSRTVTSVMVAHADLVIGMAREHVREAVALAPESWPRAFTLKELVRRAAGVGPRPPEESLDGWLDRVHEGRRPAELLGWSPDDDVADPIGLSPSFYAETADEIDRLVDKLVGLAWAAELQTTEGRR